MSVCVAVTDNKEGQAALEAATREAALLGVPLVVVNLTGEQIPPDLLVGSAPYEVVVPGGPADADEVEQVLGVLEDRPEVTRLVVGVRPRSPIGKVLLGSIPQRLILEAQVPVLAVKSAHA
jgi:nucleotide-binding universal stress UspA family protein